MTAVAAALASFWTTVRLSRPGLDRVGFEAAQAKTLGRWLAGNLPQVLAYAGGRATCAICRSSTKLS